MRDQTIDAVLEFVLENDVKFIRLAYCDIFGQEKNMSIMSTELEEALTMGIHFDGFIVPGYEDNEYQDLYLKPDPSTLCVLPWRPQHGRVVRFFCDIIQPDGTPFPYDARKFLKDTLQECADMGFACRTGLRSEFYLFKTDENGLPTTEPLDDAGYCDIAPRDRGENIRREICLCLEEMGIQPECSHHEAGPGQNEITFRASDPLGTADDYITYKNVIGAISARNGVAASFAPKPIKGVSGNGLHIKFCTYKNGRKTDETDPSFMDHFMAGIFNRTKDITVFLNTTVESYERFGENEAPKYITWSTQNRSRLMRTPIVAGKRTCFILRSPDSGINPYLAIAMVIQAGLAGLRGSEELPAPVNTSMRNMSIEEKQEYDKLPGSLAEAIYVAKNSDFLKSSACCEIAERFIKIIEKERV